MQEAIPWTRTAVTTIMQSNQRTSKTAPTACTGLVAGCGIEYKVKANNKTELVHECFPTPGRSKHVRGLWF